MTRTGAATLTDGKTREARLARVYTDVMPEAVRLAHYLTNDRELAADLAQEAFIRAAGRFQYLRSADSFRLYLRRTVMNLCKNHYRRLAVERAFLRREAATEIPVEDFPNIEAKEEVRKGLESLPFRQRSAVVLRYYMGMSQLEVAESLRCSEGAAKSLINRGLNALRGSLSKEAGEDER